jgi:competence protein ComEA
VGVDRDRLRTAGWVAAALVAVVLCVRALGGGGGESVPVRVEEAPAGRGAGPPRAQVVVQVAGEVRRPGVYPVAAGARVNDAVLLAGGLTRRADPAGVNLVAKVADGQQIVVPRRGAAAVGAGGPGTTAGPGAASPGAPSPGLPGAPSPGSPGAPKLSLASATPEQLDAIDGIGPTLARRIVEYRTQHGGFRSVDELRQVEGIGEKRFESLRDAVAP